MDTQSILSLAFYVGWLTTGLLVLMLIVSIFFGGLDLDGDADADFDGDSGGLGILKSILVFIGIGCLTLFAIKDNTALSWPVAIVSSIAAGGASIFVLSQLLLLLLAQQEAGNWHLIDAQGQLGKVYIPIPANGIGKVTIPVNGVAREIRAKSSNGKPIPSNTSVEVIGIEDDMLIVGRRDS